MRRGSQVAIWVAIAVFAVGCPKDKASHEYQSGRKAEEVKDWDTAVDFYLQANKADPNNVNVKIRLDQARFEAGQVHVAQGIKLRDKGDLQGAVSQFQRSQILDPSNITADQELKKIGKRWLSGSFGAHPASSAIPPSINQRRMTSGLRVVRLAG